MITVVETDAGYGGMGDATSKKVATFDTPEMALEALKERGFYVDWDGNALPTDGTFRPSRYHVDTARRHCIGHLSYRLEGLPTPPPHNRLP